MEKTCMTARIISYSFSLLNLAGCVRLAVRCVRRMGAYLSPRLCVAVSPRCLAPIFFFLLVPLSACLLVAPAYAGPLPPELVEGGVMFRYEDPVAEQVSVAGTFNQWNDKTLAMQREADRFVIVVPLAEGSYKYKYVIDGQWMGGDDLTVNIIRREGRLYIHPREPFLKFPFNSRIDMNGYYLFYSALTDDVDGAGGKIRAQTPRNDLDLNFDIHPTDILRAWVQINANTVNNDDKFNLDEAFLELQLGPFTMRPFETHWNLSFDDPFRILDGEVQYFDHTVYLTDDPRPFHQKYGRYARGFSTEYTAGPWMGQLFFSNRVNLDQSAVDADLWGLRLKRQGRAVTWGLSFLQSQTPNGLKADANGDGNTTENATTDLGATTIEYPYGSGTYYQVNHVGMIKPGGKNQRLQEGVDVTVKTGRWTFMGELLATQNDAAALVWSSGNSRRVWGKPYGQSVVSGGGAAGFERVFGDESDGLSILLGGIYRAQTWASELSLRMYNYRANYFAGATATDTSIKKISPDWVEVIHRLKLNQKPNPEWGLEIESRMTDRSSAGLIGNLFYRETIGVGNYFYTEVPWAKTTIAERINYDWKFHKKAAFFMRVDWMNLDRYGSDLGRKDFQTLIGMPRVDWRLSNKWTMDVGMRYASLDFGDGMKDAFMKGFLGVRYEWSKLFHIRFWTGMDPYGDEDKKLGADWRVQDIFGPASETIVSRGLDTGGDASLGRTLLETEDRFDRESIFAIQAEMRF